MGSHMDVDAVDASGLTAAQDKELRIAGSENLKRVSTFKSELSPQRLLAFMEHKTVWHPIGL
jgi:hypothetical protein